jgi:hypothetical protein
VTAYLLNSSLGLENPNPVTATRAFQTSATAGCDSDALVVAVSGLQKQFNSTKALLIITVLLYKKCCVSFKKMVMFCFNH